MRGQARRIPTVDEQVSESSHDQPSRERWETAVGYCIVSLVTVLFAALMALLVPGSHDDQGLILIAGGAVAFVLGAVNGGATKGRGLPVPLGLSGAIFGVIEVAAGLMLIASNAGR
jgi:hypothetical protein